jgi:glycosyltransferase involved in cell wall biosynthesis
VKDTLAPLVLFAYNRPEHLRQTVETLLLNPEAPDTDLIVYSDGPKDASQAAAVSKVRRYLSEVAGFRSIAVVERPENFGLANSIIQGVTTQLEQHGSVIVLEDDLAVSPYFLAYMNEGLRRYQHCERIASIHGYSYPVDDNLPPTFFLQGADCWGWATWSRAWRHFEPDGRKLEQALRSQRLVRAFDLDGRYPYLRMLRRQIAGRNNSWAIRWHASAFVAGMLTLYPGRSHVVNFGADGSGTHCKTSISLGENLASAPTILEDIPLAVNEAAREAIGKYLKKFRQRLWAARIRRLFGAN